MTFLGIMLAAAVAAEPATVAPLTPQQVASAKQLVVSKCAGCHERDKRVFDAKKVPDGKWDSLIRNMGRKAKLTGDEFNLVYRYMGDVRAGKAALPENLPAVVKPPQGQPRSSAEPRTTDRTG